MTLFDFISHAGRDQFQLMEKMYIHTPSAETESEILDSFLMEGQLALYFSVIEYLDGKKKSVIQRLDLLQSKIAGAPNVNIIDLYIAICKSHVNSGYSLTPEIIQQLNVINSYTK